MLRFLEPVSPEVFDGGADADHPMRAVTRDTAFSPETWTADRARKVGQLFDDLAPDWHEKLTAGRMDSVVDALDRGLRHPGGSTDRADDPVPVHRALEVGSGTGFATPYLAEAFRRVVALDLSMEMLRLAPPEVACRVAGDAARLPVADGSVDAVVLVNALLFPAEVDRVLSPRGTVVWVNSLGTRTPIHLSAEDAVAALPGRWTAVASQFGIGTWMCARRETEREREMAM